MIAKLKQYAHFCFELKRRKKFMVMPPKINEAKRIDNIKAIGFVLKTGGCSRLNCHGDFHTNINKFDCPLLRACAESSSTTKTQNALQWMLENNITKDDVLEYLFEGE